MGVLRAAAAAVTLLAMLPATAGQRSAAEVAAFKRANPCPATGLRRGACPGYEVDHIEPLCAGGPDERANMQWLTVAEHRVKTRYDVRACRLIKAAPRP